MQSFRSQDIALTLSVNGVREIEPGRFLLIYRHLKPIEGELELSYRGRDAKRFGAALTEGRQLTGRGGINNIPDVARADRYGSAAAG